MKKISAATHTKLNAIAEKLIDDNLEEIKLHLKRGVITHLIEDICFVDREQAETLNPAFNDADYINAFELPQVGSI